MLKRHSVLALACVVPALILIGTLLADSTKLKAIGGTPNEALRKLATRGTDPYVFREDREFAEAPEPPPTEPGEAAAKPPPVVPEHYSDTCWAASLDLSGIPWHTRISGAAITRRHVVTAAHWANLPPSVSFQSREGKTVRVSFLAADPADHPGFKPTRMSVPERPACWMHLGNDVAIATTSEPLPNSIAVYPLPGSLIEAMGDQLVGHTVLSTHMSDDNHQPEPRGLRLAGLRKVARFGGRTIAFGRDMELPGELYFKAVVGDSGNPLFFLNPYSNKLILVSTFSGGGGGSGPYYGSAEIQENILKYIAASPAPDERFASIDLRSKE